MKNQAKFVKSLKDILKKEIGHSNSSISRAIGDMNFRDCQHYQSVIRTCEWIQDQIACYEQYGEFKK